MLGLIEIPKHKHQITNKSQTPIFNDQNIAIQNKIHPHAQPWVTKNPVFLRPVSNDLVVSSFEFWLL